MPPFSKPGLDAWWDNVRVRHSAGLGYHRRMRKLALALLIMFALPTAARADFGIGLFLGEPTGLDVKIGVGPRSGLDIVVGAVSFRENRGRDTDYAHLTYLLTPFVGRGRSFLVPLRLGIGGAAIAVVDDNAHFAVRAPFELGLRFRRTPLEIYGEIAVKYTFDVADNTDVDGGIGLRFYF